jgi:catechol 2,3-dioxygenase-like lactoylglutathione lyase family enzyme
MRLQLALNVTDLAQSIEFYEKMFDTPVAKVRNGYANFEVQNPPVKLVLFETPGAGGTLNHLGVEVEHADQVEAAEQRIAQAGLETTGVDDTLCCYAAKTETWVEGPDTKWEWYVKNADADQFENVVVTTGGNPCCS